MARVLPDTMRPRSGGSAKALLLTVLGEMVLPRGGAVWTSTLVEGLGVLGAGERNARQAVSRLADQGVVRSEKEGRKARWHLTDQGTHLLTEGTARIYGFGAADAGWDGRWLVVLCSVPEDQRTRRHQLRTRLGFLGFGFLGPGVALSPHAEREAAAAAVLADLDLLPGAVVFRAEAGDVTAPGDLLRRAWDLDALGADYGEFVAGFAARAPASGSDEFGALVELVHTWRRFPFVDPEIPDRLLPRGWPGHRAKELFDARHAAWAPGANAWFDAIEAAAAT